MNAIRLFYFWWGNLLYTVSEDNAASEWGRFIPVVNLFLVATPLVVLAMTWYSFFSFGNDDFAGIFFVIFLVPTIYYSILLRWAILIVKRKTAASGKLGESFVLFLFITIPGSVMWWVIAHIV